MSPALLRLVLLVSCAHAMVHVYELSLPSVEQLIAEDYDVDTAITGWLSVSFRVPFGAFAMIVGWMADRWGAKRMLMIYLFGCAAAALAASIAPGLDLLFVVMFCLGAFSCIYHPAGLALLAHETSPANRPRALGTHGIFGSLGIGGAPFFAGLVLSFPSATWQTYYAVLAVPGVLLGLLFLGRLDDRRTTIDSGDSSLRPGEDDGRWGSYFLLTCYGVIVGLIYAAFLSFLPRYLDRARIEFASIPPEGMRNYLTGCVLLLGMVGQYTAGRLARPHTLEAMLALIMLGNAPFLAWMAVAQGPARVWAAAGFALVHFMNQPIYNSAIANYVPRRRRSLCYGFSFMMTFGLGSIGAWFAGVMKSGRYSLESPSDVIVYGSLAGMAVAAGFFAGLLWKVNRGHNSSSKSM